MSKIKEYRVKGNGVKIFIAEDYDALSQKGAELIAAVIQADPNCILGLATGSSPIGLYNELVRLYEDQAVDFKNVRSYNLDEYYPLAPDHDQSYRYFMNKNLFSRVNIDPANTHVPDGLAQDVEAFCAAYDEEIAAAGGIDIQLLGIGNNGHIGFNEPGSCFIRGTHKVTLTQSTIEANSRLFDRIEDVPKAAVTMGVGTIMNAKKVLLIANGPKKADAVRDALQGEISPACQASLLQLHRDVTFVLDRDAAAKLTDLIEVK